MTIRLLDKDGKLNPEFIREAKLAEQETETLIAERINLSIMLTGGVYLLSDAEKILYVGETACFAVRIASHYADARIPFSRVEIIPQNDIKKRVHLEEVLIRKIRPPYNNQVRSGTTRNFKNQYKKPGYVSTFDKSNMVDPEFDGE